jgi:hypothetical protein
MLVGLAGVFVGLAAGVGVLYLRLPPLIQSVAAVFFAVLLSSGVTIFLRIAIQSLATPAADISLLGLRTSCILASC